MYTRRSDRVSIGAYTLVELAIAVTLLGIIIGSGLTIMTANNNEAQITQLNMNVGRIESAIARFVRQHDRLPCPASPTAAENTSGFAVEDNCDALSPGLGGIVVVNAGTGDEIWFGSLPTRSLGLPDRFGFDPWGGRYTYVVAKNFADSLTAFSVDTASAAGAMIRIRDAGGNQVNPASTANPVVYALISHGEDKRGAYTKAGTLSVTCGSANPHLDVENCDHTDGANKDSLFTDRPIQSGQTQSQYFFDILSWKTKHNFNQ